MWKVELKDFERKENMGHYCCCGERTINPCKCEWADWNYLSDNPSDLPKEEGEYIVRIAEDGECFESTSKFSLEPKVWDSTSYPMQWEKDYFDGWVGCRCVYAWKEKDLEE